MAAACAHQPVPTAHGADGADGALYVPTDAQRGISRRCTERKGASKTTISSVENTELALEKNPNAVVVRVRDWRLSFLNCMPPVLNRYITKRTDEWTQEEWGAPKLRYGEIPTILTDRIGLRSPQSLEHSLSLPMCSRQDNLSVTS